MVYRAILIPKRFYPTFSVIRSRNVTFHTAYMFGVEIHSFNWYRPKCFRFAPINTVPCKQFNLFILHKVVEYYASN